MNRAVFVLSVWQYHVRTTSGLLVLIAGLALAGFAQAPPSADTYTASSSASTNYGASTILAVQNGVTSYVQFNLAGIPTTATVDKATLRLYVSAVTTVGSFDVYQLNRSWGELSLKYSSAPALGASATGGHPTAVTAATVNNFLVIDITSLVQGWLNGTKTNYGVALAVTGNLAGSFAFDSKESTTSSHQPELDIYFNGPAGPQGLQGPQGPQGLTGATGTTGPQGPTGSTGATGTQGLQGLTGPAGSQGPSGLQGVPGPAGAIGVGFNFRNGFDNSVAYGVNDVVTYGGSTYVATAASQGPNNPTPNVNTAGWSLMAQQGTTGATGSLGPQGLTGATGATGPQGATGATGSQGPIGLTGATGPQGPVGLTGAQGSQGPIGLTGATGPQGVQGPAGSNGVGFNFRYGFDNSVAYAVNDVVTYGGSAYVATAASQGPNNPTPNVNTAGWSLMAQQGTTGATGSQGLTGATGATGPQGATGATGSQGPIGFTGATGPQGPVGLTGAQGSQGPIGLTGAPGSQGVQGPAGNNGVGFNFRNGFDNTVAYAVNDVVTYGGSTYVATTASQGPNNPTPNVNTAGWSVMAQQGATGSTGLQGPQGLTGATGATGPQGANGATGPQGPIGLTGVTGPQGLQGVQGPAGSNGVGFNFRNGFDNSVAYAVNDVVTYGGSTYVATTASQGPNNPTPNVNTAGWSVMAQQGTAGPQGLAGATGATGPQGLTGATGSQGPIGLTGVTGPQGLIGFTGTQGPQGPQGLTGATGSQGVQGPAGASGTSFTFRDAFDNSVAYALNDVVTYGGSSYVAITTSQGPNNPTPDVNSAGWSPMAQQGANGATGPQGATGATGGPGPQGPIGLTGATGSQGPIGVTGSLGPQGLQGVTGPTGPQGPQGVLGPAGANGVSFTFRDVFDNSLAYALNDVVTYGGSAYIATAASQGPNNSTPDVNAAAWSLMAQQGATGAVGPSGPAGSQGTPGATGPQGPQGIQGSVGATGATGAAGAVDTDSIGVQPTGTGVVFSSPGTPNTYTTVGPMAQVYTAFCTGQVGGNDDNYFLSPGSLDLTCSGSTSTASSAMRRISLPPGIASCKMQQMQVQAAVAGLWFDSGVVTLWTGSGTAAPTALSCTLGAGLQCSDLTDAVTLNAGDNFNWAITTNNDSDATAAVEVTAVCTYP